MAWSPVDYRPARLLVDTLHVLGRKGDELVEIPRGGAAASSGKSEVHRETSSWNTRPRRKTKPAGFFSQIREALEAQHMARNLHHRVSHHMHIQKRHPGIEVEDTWNSRRCDDDGMATCLANESSS